MYPIPHPAFSTFPVNPNNGLDVAVYGGKDTSPGKGPNAIILILLINEDSQWSSLTVNYLASARLDFVVGSYAVATLLLQQGSNSNGALTAAYAIPGWTSQATQFRVVVEISGIRVAASPFRATLDSVAFSQQSGLISVSMTLVSSPLIESLLISYIVWSSSSPFTQTVYSVGQTVSFPYLFVGLDTVSNSGMVLSGNGFSSANSNVQGVTCVGSRCGTSCVTVQTCTSNSGQVLNNVCYLCATGEVISNGQCISTVPCGANQQRDQNNQCVCVSGYLMVSNVCYLQCAQNAAIINGTCQCIPGYVLQGNQCVVSVPCGANQQKDQNNQCVCVNGYQMVSNVCYQICAQNAVFMNGACQCAPGYALQNNQCVTSTPCGANQQKDQNNLCVCVSGYQMVSGVCYQICAQNAVIISGACQCIPGYILQGNQCLVSTPCGANQQRDQNNLCVCVSGWQMVSGVCYQICASNAVIINGACQCVPGYILQGNQCVVSVPCGVNQQRDQNNQCVCVSGFQMVSSVCYQICAANAVIMNGACQCIPGYSFSNQLNRCVQSPTCPTNWVLSNGVCVCPLPLGIINSDCLTCPPYSYVGPTGRCTCQSGYSFNSTSRTCLQDCFANAYRNQFGDCVCNNGYYRVGNSCVPQNPCTVAGQTNSGSGCVCPQGQIVDINLNKCSYCNAPGEQRQLDGTCNCVSVYQPTASGCQPCPANSQYSSGQQRCLCNSGYSLSATGLCVPQCPSGAYFDSSLGRCVCQQSNQYVIDGYCQVCVVNTHYDSVSGRCVCDAGYAKNSYDQCQRCDLNSRYNAAGTACLCNDGYFGTGFICSLCDPTCRTCSGPGRSQCLSCNSSAPSSGYCLVTCPSGQYRDSTNQCQACSANCLACTSAITCSSCQNGYSAVTNGGVTTCQINTPSSSLEITLKNHVLLNNQIYLGLTINLLPTAILPCGTICNNIFQVNVNSQTAVITTSQQFVSNTVYWFVVAFSFPNSSFVPTFDYTIRLNPSYAGYFQAVDMTIVKQGSFSSSDFPAAVNTTPTAGSTGRPTAGAANPNAGGNSQGGLSQSTINQLFAQ
jgi:hypothetical protein